MGSSGSLQYTGERYMPLLRPPNHPGNLFHDERYELAAMFCHGKSVLEIGCGAGYGAAILAREAASVYAFDYSQEAIEYCKEHYLADNINFYMVDFHDYQVKSHFYDVVVTYEFLEHIMDGDRLMVLIKEALVPGGMAFISTPKPPGHSRFHVHEYELEEFESLLSAHFQKYVMLNHRPGTFSFRLKDAHTYIGIVWNG